MKSRIREYDEEVNKILSTEKNLPSKDKFILGLIANHLNELSWQVKTGIDTAASNERIIEIKEYLPKITNDKVTKLLEKVERLGELSAAAKTSPRGEKHQHETPTSSPRQSESPPRKRANAFHHVGLFDKHAIDKSPKPGTTEYKVAVLQAQVNRRDGDETEADDKLLAEYEKKPGKGRK